MAKVVCVLYEDPLEGYPPEYPRAELPRIPADEDDLGGPTATVGFAAELLGSVSGELGLRRFLRERGHRLVVTSDKDGPESVFERELTDADVVISQPSWPAYLTAERIAKAANLKLALTAGGGSEHIDLRAASERGITVAEVSDAASVSVAEQVVMMILALVRNYLPSHRVLLDGGWNIADCAARCYDLQGMRVGTIAAGRVGCAILRRLEPFEVSLHYTDTRRLEGALERQLGVTFHADTRSLVQVCDVVSINAPLGPGTESLFDAELISTMKRGSYLINTSHARICDRDAIARACRSGQLAGYAGDVWFPAPPAAEHPWRTMPHHGMTPPIAGTSLSAQARCAAGVREILECHFAGRPIRERYLILGAGSPPVEFDPQPARMNG